MAAQWMAGFVARCFRCGQVAFLFQYLAAGGDLDLNLGPYPCL